MRCLALAQELRKAGVKAMFAVAAIAEELRKRIRSEGFEVSFIAAEPGSATDSLCTSSLLSRNDCDWLVLDGYHFSDQYRRSVAAVSRHLLLMDDGDPRPLCDCDIVVNPDIEDWNTRYPARSQRTQFLLGPKFAFLRREFLNARANHLPSPIATRILVTMGGADPNNVTLQVLEALQHIPEPHLEVVIVTGASNPHTERIRQGIVKSCHKVSLLTNVKDMPELMLNSDLAVTGCGGTWCELAYMKVPMLLITIAVNQESLANSLAREEAALSLGWFGSLSPADIAKGLQSLIANQKLRSGVIANAAELVDGKGAERVVSAMKMVSSSKDSPRLLVVR